MRERVLLFLIACVGVLRPATEAERALGRSNSKVFPTISGAYQKENRGGFCDFNTSALRDCFDAFGAKLDPAARLSTRPCSTDPWTRRVDEAGNAYVTGKIWGPGLLRIRTLNASGSALVFSVFDKNALGNAIALGKDGNIWVTGDPHESMPLEKPLRNQLGGGLNDAFVLKVSQTVEERP